MIKLTLPNTKAHLHRQFHHWMHAAVRLSRMENHASSEAWKGVDPQLSGMIRTSLISSAEAVVSYGKKVEQILEIGTDEKSIRKDIQQLREMYLKAETTIHFFMDALKSRTNDSISSLLKACDVLCVKSMQSILPSLGKKTPLVLSYLDKGLGASILKASVRLWDGNSLPVAAIKITQHNLLRPTAIIHETGHQVSHELNWNEELSNILREELSKEDAEVGPIVASWASEMAADAFAFVHCGYAAVSSLHNVLAGSQDSVMAYHQHDPHPISYVRMCINIECCRIFFGNGPWDELEEQFKEDYPLDKKRFDHIPLISKCLLMKQRIVQVLFNKSYKAFNNRTIVSILNPDRVSPQNLLKLESQHGPALYTSPPLLYSECIRLLGLNGYQIATGNNQLQNEYQRQISWMTKLGNITQLN
jgi:hypothetical protein